MRAVLVASWAVLMLLAGGISELLGGFQAQINLPAWMNSASDVELEKIPQEIQPEELWTGRTAEIEKSDEANELEELDEVNEPESDELGGEGGKR